MPTPPAPRTHHVNPARGLVPILATPFAASGALDVPSLHRLVEFLLACRVDGIALFGMASEGFALTAVERAVILREVRRVTGPDLLIVAGVSATGIEPAIEQALAARDDADVLMVLPPFLVKPVPAQLVDFYGAVAEAAGRNVMVQDAPAATGVNMSVALIRELSHLDGVTSVKVETQPTAPKVSAVVAAVAPAFDVLGGQNALFLLEEYPRGAVGTMPACEFADLLAPVVAALDEDRLDVAQDAFDPLLPLIRFGMQPGIAWAVHKEVLVARHVIETATVRSPAQPLDGVSRNELARILNRLPLHAAAKV